MASIYYQKRNEIRAVWLLIVLNVIVFLINNVLGGSNTPLSEIGALNNYYLRDGQVWRVITSMFLHGNMMHLLFNMWGLWMFGSSLELTIGSRRFVMLYFIAGLGGALFWGLASPWNTVQFALPAPEGGFLVYQTSFQEFKNHLPNLQHGWIILNSCIGASGAVTGVVLGMALIAPQTRIQLIFPPIPMTLKTFAIGYIIVEMFLSGKGDDNVAHIAHVGGGICGFLYLLFECFREPALYFVSDRLKLWWYRVTKGKILNSQFNAKRHTTHRDYNSAGYRDADQNQSHRHVSQLEIIAILQKIKTEGIDALTVDEAKILKEAKKTFHSSKD